MEVSGQLPVKATFSLGKESSIPTEQEAGWAPEPVWICEDEP